MTSPARLAELLAGGGSGSRRRRSRIAQWETIGRGGVELVPTRGLVEALRAVKDEDELDAIRRAAAISDAVYEALAGEQLVGRAEADVAWWIERTFREHGAEALAFGSIVGVGRERRAAARGRGRRRSSRRERSSPSTWVASSTATAPTARGRSRPVSCRRSSPRHTSSCARRSSTASRRCARARRRRGRRGFADAIAAAGLADAYGHGLGHGVGLEVHEAPTLRPESTSVLAVGNVVTVEPGLYLPGVGGCRIEDLVAVTADGCEIMTHFTKDLLVVS